MSSSAQGGSGGQGDKPQGFSRLIRRATKVLKRGSSQKSSTTSAAEVTPTSSRSIVPPLPSVAPLSSSLTTAPATVAPQVEATSPSVATALHQSIKDTKPETKIFGDKRLVKTAAASSAMQEEKARALFVKYDMKLEPGEWTHPVRGDAERVEKKIRMRVHRTCHRCSTTFGREKVCANCQHTRCKKCPRFPTKKSKDPMAKPSIYGLSAIAVDESLKDKRTVTMMPLTMPHRPTGKDLVRRGPVQRVRRTCHKCESLFVGKATQCETCKHLRCPRCPREPPKTSKYPEGYPGDAEETFPLALRELRRIRTRVRWTCHACQTVFKDHEKICGSCSHERCNECGRQPPKKVRAPLDEAAVQSISEKMKSVQLSPQASAA